MMFTQNVHQQFAQFFRDPELEPFLYLLSKKLHEGHICIRLTDWLGKPVDELYTMPERLPEANALIGQMGENKPLIAHNGYLYLHRYFYYETLLLQRIQALLQQEKKAPATYFPESLLNSLFPEPQQDINWQLVAVILSLSQRFTIITGGPGTGKTTTVARMLHILFSLQADARVALTAPTGKAASRMAESLRNAAADPAIASNQATAVRFRNLEPLTIHRLLGQGKDAVHFKHNRARPLPYDVIVVDESSMIDVALFAKLMDAVSDGAKVVLLGDKDQLASVEAGSLFGELCTAQPQLNQISRETAHRLAQYMPQHKTQLERIATTSTHLLFEHVIELQKSHRFSAHEGIGKLSKAIILGEWPGVSGFFQNADERVQFDGEYREEVFEGFVSQYEAYIRETDAGEALKKLNRLRVLCATRQGEYGVFETNRKIERILQHRKWIQITGEFYENRPVMVTKNNYRYGLFNGDTGIVRKNKNGDLVGFFVQGEGVTEIPVAFLQGVETVFAMTIHKSQGSEFNQALILLPETEDLALLTRELLYTGVTRAREKVTLQARPQVVEQSISRQVNRSSGIRARFDETYAANPILFT